MLSSQSVASKPLQSQPERIKVPIKRSASTMSLPTPPRTRRRRKRRVGGQGSLSPVYSDDEERGEKLDEEDSGTDLELPLPEQPPTKRLRTGGKSQNQDDEEAAFWLDKPAPPTNSSKGPPTTTVGSSDDDDDGVEALLRRKRDRRERLGAHHSLVSPPPSHRKLPPLVPASATSASPVTPIRDNKESVPSVPTTPDISPGSIIAQDSPDNPFLDSGDEEVDAGDEDVDAAPKSCPWWEKPVRVMIQRGKKVHIKNPYWDPIANAPIPMDPNSLLPPEHIDFETDLRCEPRVLFPKLDKDGKPIARRRRKADPSAAPQPKTKSKPKKLPREVQSGLSTPDGSESEDMEVAKMGESL